MGMAFFRLDSGMIPSGFDNILKYSSSHKNSFDVCPVEIVLTKEIYEIRYLVMQINFYYVSRITC